MVGQGPRVLLIVPGTAARSPPEAPQSPRRVVFLPRVLLAAVRDHVYCVTEEGFLYAFATQTGVLERIPDPVKACSGLEARPPRTCPGAGALL